MKFSLAILSLTVTSAAAFAPSTFRPASTVAVQMGGEPDDAGALDLDLEEMFDM